MKINVKVLILPVFILLGLIFASIYYWPSRNLAIHFCDVGQGDAIYIRAPNGADIVIDGGPNNRILSCLGSFMPFYDRTIELVVLTHPEKDHYFGLTEVVNRYKIINFVTVPVGNTSEDYKKFVNAVKSKNIQPRYFTSGEKIIIADVVVNTLWPQKEWLLSKIENEMLFQTLSSAQPANIITTEAQNNLNDFSLYMLLTFGDFDLLLTGDGDQRVQPFILQSQSKALKPIEVLKVPHHGSKTAISPELVELLKPKVSVFEVGKNNYGHPNGDLIKKLESFGRVMRTDNHGTVKIETDGKKFTINTQTARK